MSEYPSPLGSLSSGTLLGDTGGGPTPPPRKPWLPVVVIALIAVVALVMVAGAAILLLSSGSSDSSATPAPTQAGAPERPSTATPEAPAEPAPPERPSGLSPKGSADALRAIRAAAKGRDAMTLRVDPDGMTAIVKGKVIVYRNGQLQVLPGPPTTPFKFSLDDVDPAAPSRINKLVRERGKQVEYLVYVVNPVDKAVTWTIVTKDSKNYSADPAGRRLCKLAFSC
jgi:pyruvate/2-oxoglutarate dehydrogenase complex dihydrolipoamide acyltransferase (E2) component